MVQSLREHVFTFWGAFCTAAVAETVVPALQMAGLAVDLIFMHSYCCAVQVLPAYH